MLPLEVFRAHPTGRRPRGRPRTRWRDYISLLAWERLGIPQEELESVAVVLSVNVMMMCGWTVICGDYSRWLRQQPCGAPVLRTRVDEVLLPIITT